ncbi:MAG TPA: carboxypeptidase-like regulatory domain-containing protein [Anaerolineales bacterium]|nr:carboxypeptidase-like regulatory domain-containing protein [Anaerolineales bacterium]
MLNTYMRLFIVALLFWLTGQPLAVGKARTETFSTLFSPFSAPAAGGSIEGRITDVSNGAGIENVLMYADNGSYHTQVFSNSSGYYTFNNLPASVYNVVAFGGRYANAHRYSVPVSEGGTTSGVNFALTTKMGQMHGRVTDKDGKPISRVDVMADSDEGTGFSADFTDANGEYLLTNLAPMKYYIHASKQGYAGVVKMANVADGQTIENFNFVLGSYSGGIRGQVTKSGEPAGEAQLYVNSSEGSAQTYFDHVIADINGYYELNNLPPGSYDVHAYDVPGYANQYIVRIQVGQAFVENVNFDLENGRAKIIGTVTGPNGEPIIGAKVQAFLARSPGTWASVTTDGQGNYYIDKMWSGNYNFYVDFTDYPQVTKRDVPIPDAATTRIDFIMGVPRVLTSQPQEARTAQEKDGSIWFTLLIGVDDGSQLTWTATTSNSWVYFGKTGNNKQASGGTGGKLTVRLDHSGLAYGLHSAEVKITAQNAGAVKVPITLNLVRKMEKVFLPIIPRE